MGDSAISPFREGPINQEKRSARFPQRAQDRRVESAIAKCLSLWQKTTLSHQLVQLGANFPTAFGCDPRQGEFGEA